MATFTADDPEGAGINWTVDGTDSGKFDITGGVLTFKMPPNFEMPGDIEHIAEDDDQDVPIIEGDADNVLDNNEYVLIVKASEMQDDDEMGNALFATMLIVVEVTDVDEPGTVTISLRQPEDQTALTATLTDPDVGEDSGTAPIDPSYQWSVPKVSRPVTDNDEHWQDATGSGNNTDNFTPGPDDVGEFLRVKVEYADAEDSGKKAYAKSEFEVRADVDAADNSSPAFATDDPISRQIPENSATGTAVGAPVAASDTDERDSGRLTYSLGTANDEEFFSIDKATGQIRVDGMLDAERNTTDDNADNDGVYSVVVIATDSSGEGGSEDNDTITVNITATNVDEAPTVSGMAADTDPDAMHTVVEGMNLHDPADLTNAPDELKYLAVHTDVDDEGKVSLKLSGDDASAFELEDADGAGTETVQVLLFKSAPDFESPTDMGGDNSYKVNVVAVDDAGNEMEFAVTVTVTNIDEVGKVTLSHTQPGAGQEITAALTDPDGGVNSVKWQWYSSETSGGNFAMIDGATSMSYTPTMTVPDDEATEADEAVDGDDGTFTNIPGAASDTYTPKAAVDGRPGHDKHRRD